MRRVTFLYSTLDWDESLYLLVARALLHGHLPYTTVYDNKPPGIYFLFALGQLVFGRSVVGVRILTCVAIALTSAGLRSIGGRLAPARPWTGWAAGFLYAAYAVAVDAASNTELFFAPFTVAAVALILPALIARAGITGRRALAAGLLAGLALQVKPFAILELGGIAFWGAGRLAAGRPRAGVPEAFGAWRPVAMFACGLLLPAVAVAGLFVLSGHVPEYLDANLRANRVLAGLIHPDPGEFAANTWRQAVRAWPLWTAAIVGVAAWFVAGRKARERGETMAPVLAWFGCAMAAVGVVGGRFPHYFLEPLVPLALLAASGATRAAGWLPRRWTVPGRAALLVLAAALLWRENEPLQRRYRAVVAEREATADPAAGDPMAGIARRIRDEAAPGDRLYVVDHGVVLYALLDLPAPTRFAFPPFLADTTLNRVAGVDAVRELRSILSIAPRFLVRGQPLSNAAFYRVLDPLVDRFYEPDAAFPTARILRLRDGVADSLRRFVAGGADSR